MKQFVCRFVIWASVVVILAIATDYVITTGLKKTDIRKYSTWNDIYKGELDADLLVIGASNAWSGFNTYILDTLLDLNSYNLGLDGSSIDLHIIRYDTYRRFNSKPKIVLINTLYAGIFSVSADSQYEREQYFPYIHDKELISRIADAKEITWMDQYVPLARYFGYREEIKNGVLGYFGETNFLDGGMHKGYRGNEYEWNRGTLSMDTVFTVHIDKQAVMLFDSFSKQLKEDGIEVVYVKSPVYYQLITKIANIGQVDSIFDAISKKYSIPIFDYYYSDISKDSTYFYNPGHLNKKGSELFTTMLCKDLDSLGIIHK